MFWGLIMEPGKKYSQTVEKSFHVSHAALDLDSAQSSPVQVLLGFEGRNYLLCTLNKDKWIQVSLDLNFQVGDKVSFATNGPGHVHLTGFLIPDDDLDIDEELSDEEEQEDEEVPELLPINNKKRKAETKNEDKNKKSKFEAAKLLDEINEDDTDDEDDSDVNLTDLIEEEADEDEAEDEEDEGVDDDDDEDEEEESEEEEQPIQKMKKEKPKQNGVVKNDKPEKQKKDKSPKQNKQVEKTQNKLTPNKEQKSEKSPKNKGKRTLQGGVVVEDLKVGDGSVAQPGKQVQVYYEGRLQSNNKVFDATKKGNGFKFRLGKHEVIKGWDIGVQGMKVGGKRRIICPPQVAYGAQGSPPVIPPQSTLIFEVELKNVK